MIYEKFFLFICVVFSSSQCSPIGSNLRDAYMTSDPDTYLAPPKIIRKNGYPAESHVIKSEDGYLLEYHRIPRDKNDRKPTQSYPILIHHGLLCSSFDWIMNGPKRSIGYRFADEGYDVWLGNARGNTYSRGHVFLTPKDEQFWNFSFHEMGVNDLSAAIDYILAITNSSQIIYIGHSQGTTMFYALMSTKPEYNAKVLVHVGIAPVAMLGHTTSAFRLFVPFAKEIKTMTNWYNKGAFLERDLMSSIITKILCGSSTLSYVCEQLIIFKITGKDSEQFNKNMMPVITAHAPAGTSAKNMVHYAQLISSSRFLQYDYGVKENIVKYGSAHPPAYNLSKISVPAKFYYGENDILADPLDVKLLYHQLPKVMGCKAIDYPKWNHVDFIWAIDINKYFNDDLIEFVNSCSQNANNFIANQVAKGFEERLASAVPIDRPFDVDRFMNNKLNGLPPLGNVNAVSQLTTEVDQSNFIQDYTSKIKDQVQQNIDKVKSDVTDHATRVQNAFSETLHKTGRSLSDNAYNVHANFETNISNAKKTIDKSIRDIDAKVREMLDKLGRGFA